MVVALAMAVPMFGRKIHWNDKWEPDRKSIGVVPIEGNIDDEAGELTLHFLSDLGFVQVVITDNNGNPIYQESVDAEAELIYTIDLDELPVQGKAISVIGENNTVYGFIN